MKEMGLDISDSQLLQILDTFDADQDGEINVDEFRQLMLNIQAGKVKGLNASDFQDRASFAKKQYGNHSMVTVPSQRSKSKMEMDKEQERLSKS